MQFVNVGGARVPVPPEKTVNDKAIIVFRDSRGRTVCLCVVKMPSGQAVSTYYNDPRPPVKKVVAPMKVLWDGIEKEKINGRTLVLESVKLSRYDDQECPYCGDYPNNNSLRVNVFTDKGETSLIECCYCRKLFQPFEQEAPRQRLRSLISWFD